MKTSERERAIQIHFFPQHEVLLSLDFNYVTKQKKNNKKRSFMSNPKYRRKVHEIVYPSFICDREAWVSQGRESGHGHTIRECSR